MSTGRWSRTRCRTVTGEHVFDWSVYCGARVCDICDHHDGLERCFCGWSLTDPGNGRQELVDMGETIDEE